MARHRQDRNSTPILNEVPATNFSSALALYTVEKDGKTIKLKETQLTVQILSKIFGLYPESILLLSDDGYVEAPNDDGRFIDVDDLPIWSVSGEAVRPVQSSSGSALYQPPTTSRGSSRRGRGRIRCWTPATTYTPPGGTRKPPGVRAQEEQFETTVGREWRKYIEVCRWNERENQWKKVTNLPLEMTEATASVPHVTQMVAEDVFAGDETVLVDTDYLKIPDTSATTGEKSVFSCCICMHQLWLSYNNRKLHLTSLSLQVQSSGSLLNVFELFVSLILNKKINSIVPCCLIQAQTVTLRYLLLPNFQSETKVLTWKSVCKSWS